ncbi:hypothetical protein [Streptomyces sp. NPDC048606]|uniref:hypothetical protein n=1 Tax=Streptomyces sp. NPDC048606 TaxID=3154726 RepID=UPI003445173B
MAAAHPEPARVWAEWAERRAALVPAGRRWDAVVLPVTLYQQVAEAAPAVLAGVPVVADRRTELYYVLVPPGRGAAVVAGVPGVSARGVGAWVAVRDPGVGRVRGARVGVWVQPPGRGGRLADPVELRRALVAVCLGPASAPAAGARR